MPRETYAQWRKKCDDYTTALASKHSASPTIAISARTGLLRTTQRGSSLEQTFISSKRVYKNRAKPSMPRLNLPEEYDE